MNTPQYIWVNRWDEYQTFQNKKGKPWAPPWIKLYPQILDDPDFTGLTWMSQLLLLKLFAAFAQTRGRLPADTRELSRRLGQRVTTAQLDSLNHAGWITVCSRNVLEDFRNRFWNRSALDVEVDVEEKKTPNPQPVVPTPNGEPQQLPDLQHILRDMPL